MDQKRLEQDLKQILGDRVTTNPHERWFYRRDLLDLPRWAERLVKSMPDAIASPRNVTEVSALLKYCSENSVPVTPRGAGSSGLFGSVPKKGGVVIDLRSLDDVLEMDAQGLTVSAGAGLTWWELEKTLNRHGLTLMSYPSSARSATLGGWVATTGLGIGNIRYGAVSEQVLSAEVVLADGSVRVFSRDDGLDDFTGSEGLLGLFTRVTLKARRLPASALQQLVYFRQGGGMFAFLQRLVREQPLPYSVEFFDSVYLSMLKRSGYEFTDFSDGGGVALVACDGTSAEVEEFRGRLTGIAAHFSGELRSGGEEEWKQRFNMLRVRRAVPSLVVGSVHLPLTKLEQFGSRTAEFKSRPMGLLGHVVSKDDCVLMATMGAERGKGLRPTLALRTPAALSNIALSLGGGPGGGLGLWNAAYRNTPALKKKAALIEARKKSLDPKGILNPGMWSDPPWLLRPSVFRGAVFAGSLADRVLSASAQPIGVTVHGLESCVQCGYCMGYCPTRGQWLSSTPRGRVLAALDLLIPAVRHGEALDSEAVKDVFDCTLCGRCRLDCGVDIESPEMWADLRSRIAKAGREPDALKSLAATVHDSHNLAAKPNEQRGKWADNLKLEHRKSTADTVYFVGCVTSFYPMVQDVAKSFAQVLNKSGTDFAILGGEEWCCGYPLLSAGRSDEAASHIEANINRIMEIGAKRIVTTCPGCYRMWKQDYPRITGKAMPFDILHSTNVISGLVAEGKIAFRDAGMKVTYHDPCDLGRNAGLYDQPRYVISKIPGLDFVELESSREYCNCCGSGGDLLASNQALSLEIAGRKVKEILDTGADAVVTACPSCIRAISMARLARKAPFKVLDIAQLTWNAMIK